ncbi:phospholipase D/nuclease [Polyplosphaeria fusca]|uniref:Phospholipase D/nuclease n=1 Tax=Polyplosphaeria fusca TaxID=682080 RepID=A0A9P4QMV8_9PLEO|nr:phospholipase D/nuclease [Polyplosphaeria fusca]
MTSRISERLYRFCTDGKSVSTEYAIDASRSPGQYAKSLYGGEPRSMTESSAPHERKSATKEELESARSCGKWGDAEPSDLFLRCYHDALCSLENDTLGGMVSPSLLGSSGIIPLTILAPLPDIARHMSNLIVRAEHEVFLATNFWIASDASRIITDSLLELSRRAGEKGIRICVKVMYDRGNIKQVIDSHQIMSEKQYTSDAVRLPAAADIPNLDMEVQNYHRPALGTFHSKFMIVDRKIAIVQSNNIQDNDNLEMMTHIEGPIVDSFYDVALISWDKPLKPSLPCLNTAAAHAARTTFDEPTFKDLFEEDGSRKTINTSGLVNGHSDKERLPLHAPADPHYDPCIASEIKRSQWNLTPSHGETKMNAITQHLNCGTKINQQGNAPEAPCEDEMIPIIPHRPHSPFPIALVNRRPWGAPNHQCVNVPQNEAWLSAIRNAASNVFIQTPDLNAAPLIPALKAALERGITVTYFVCLGYNDSGELLPFQGGTNEMVANKLCDSLDLESKQRLNVHYYVAKDQMEPIHADFKQRSCHVKLMIVDGHLGIQGNGNQDTQSWYHSMEVNIMIDSKVVCEDWLEAIRRNQNTHLYGKADQDGLWRDANGNEAKGAIGKDPGRFSWAKGIIGAVQRVRGDQ